MEALEPLSYASEERTGLASCLTCVPTTQTWTRVRLHGNAERTLELIGVGDDEDAKTLASVSHQFILACTAFVPPEKAQRGRFVTAQSVVGLVRQASLHRSQSQASFLAVHYINYIPYSSDRPQLCSWKLKAPSSALAQQYIDYVNAFVANDSANKRYLVLANPMSGKRRAIKIVRKTVLPMLALAGIQFDLLETKHAGWVREHMRDIPLDKYTAVLTVSGDGIVHEVFNGLLARPDWHNARLLPVAIISGGSSNGMAKSINAEHAMVGVLMAIKNRVQPLDMMSISRDLPDNDAPDPLTPSSGNRRSMPLRPQIICYSHLSLEWALVADIDIGSEVIRSWAGPIRVDLWTLLRVFSKQLYAGRLSILPFNDYTNENELVDDYENNTELSILESTNSSLQPKYAHIPLNMLRDYQSQNEWISLPPSLYYMFLVSNVPWISTDFNAAPLARLNNGTAQLIYTNELSTRKLLKIVAGQDTGTYVELPEVSSIRVKAIILEPMSPLDEQFLSMFDQNSISSHSVDNSHHTIGLSPQPVQSIPLMSNDSQQQKQFNTQTYPAQSTEWTNKCAKEGMGVRQHGYMAVDGEEIPSGPVRLEVHRGLVRIIVPPWLDESQASKHLQKQPHQ